MGIWKSLRRFSPKRKDRQPATSGGRERKRPVHRGLRMEQFEERMLLSINPAGIDRDYLWTHQLNNAISRAADLGSYDVDMLATTDTWVVGVADGISPQQQAAALGADSLGDASLLPNGHIWQFSENQTWQDTAAALDAASGVTYFYPMVATQKELYFIPNDPLFPDQWHLQNTGQTGGTPGMDANVVPAWDGFLGTGVVIGIIDDGLQADHPDLMNNYRSDLSWDYNYNDPDPSPDLPADNHGTAVAGVAAADGDNALGVSGAAPDAQLAGLRLISAPTTDLQTANALTHMYNEIDIYNSSWGYPADLVPMEPLTMAALRDSVLNGRDGLGNIQVFAAGNSGAIGGNVNYSELQNSRFTIAVAAINDFGVQSWYSEPGAPLLVSAPSSDIIGITTTDRTGEDGYNVTGVMMDPNGPDPLPDIDYMSTFGGTSSAAPLVSGAIALILEANPELTYRDVQQILVDSSTMNDPTDWDWIQNGDGRWVNHKYGYGMINAEAAVALARSWDKVAPEQSINSAVVPLGLTIPDADFVGLQSTVTLPPGLADIEWVEVTFDASHSYPGDLEVILISPEGTQSILAEQNFNVQGVWPSGYSNWVFTSARHWGESAAGDWTLQVRDLMGLDVGTWNSWQLTAHGPLAAPLKLISVIPNDGDLLEDGETRDVGPQELLLRFNEGQTIDPATLDGIQIIRTGGDDQFDPTGTIADIVYGTGPNVDVQFGYIGIGEYPNEVIIRFAEALPDDMYRIVISGTGATPLANMDGILFNEGEDQTISFELDLGAQVIAVVPQPMMRNGDGSLSQSRNQIEVYFNDDDLDATLARRTDFYQLIVTNDTATPDDDTVLNPSVPVEYSPAENKALLTFADDLALLGTGAFRLRIGNEYRKITTTPVLAGDDQGSSFDTATDVTEWLRPSGAGPDSYSAVIQGADIAPTPFDWLYALEWPGAVDEPGHREMPFGSSVSMDDHYVLEGDVADREPGIPIIEYNFRDDYGWDPYGFQLHNIITPRQQDRAREAVELLGHYLGLQFVETFPAPGDDGGGITIATGDMRALVPGAQPDSLDMIAGTSFNLDREPIPLVVMSASNDWGNSEYGLQWFTSAMRGVFNNLGVAYADDLWPVTITGDAELPDFQNMGWNPPDPLGEPVFPGDHDIVHGQHLYRPDSNDIDIYRFTLDSAGVFSAETFAERLASSSLLDTAISLYVEQTEEIDGEMVTRRVLVARNDDYFSEDSYLEHHLEAGIYYVGVTSTGNTSYDPNIENSGVGGTSQGEYDLRFNFMPDLAEHLADETGTLFDGDADGIAGGVYDYWFNVRSLENTIFVDKTDRIGSGDAGSLTNAIRDIDDALAMAQPGDIVRIVGNGGDDGRMDTLDDNRPYEIGYDIFGNTLDDGRRMEIPQGVTVMIDAGAILKMHHANIDVGSSAQNVDRSLGALQILGTPEDSVYFTSYENEEIGVDGEPLRDTDAEQGDWGGLVFRNLLDYAADRTVLEREGIFLNYINHANFSYGGGEVMVNSIRDVYAPIHTFAARPTVSHNTITLSSDAAVSADPDSFEDSKFQGPTFTADYNRVGPDIHGNHVFENTINGLFVRIDTDPGKPTDKLEVPARFDDPDIVHVISEALYINGDPGGPTLPPATSPLELLSNRRIQILAGSQTTDTDRFTLGDVDGTVTFEFEDLLIRNGVIGGSVPISFNQGDTSAEVAQSVVNAISAAHAGGALVQLMGTNNDMLLIASPDGPAFRTDVDVEVINDPAVVDMVSFDAGRSVLTINVDPAVTTANEVIAAINAEGTFSAILDRSDDPTNNGSGTIVQTGILAWTSVGATAAAANIPAPFKNGDLWIRRDDTGYVFAGESIVFTHQSVFGNHASASYDPVSGTLTIDIDPSATTANAVIAAVKAEGTFYAGLDRSVDGANNGTGLVGPLGLMATTSFPDYLDITATSSGSVVTLAGPEITYDGLIRRVARPDARLAIDPGLVVKMNGSRIETQIGSQFIAEGTVEHPIIFTSLADFRYGAGGTFKTVQPQVIIPPFDPTDPFAEREPILVGASPAEWAGLYFGPASEASIDHALITFAGGIMPVGGAFAAFNPIEIHQATTRITNSRLVDNAGGGDLNDRDGLSWTVPATIFVRGAQPVIADNIIRHNEGPVISVNVNALNSVVMPDWGRTTGSADVVDRYADNHGPLVLGNELDDNDINGMEVRGGVTTTNVVWDDTDIVHVLFDEIIVPNHHTYGGLRLQSHANESLVVKLLSSANSEAGFTAMGVPLDISDRIGGTIQVIGAPGHPVVLTSLNDDRYGAGLDPTGEPQNDTNNDGLFFDPDLTARGVEPQPGDWRSVKMDRYVNDRNVAIVIEREDAYGTDVDINANPITAQYIGDLAGANLGGDDNLRLGFEVHGYIRLDDPNDQDVYSFTAPAGSEVWLDIDRTRNALDTVIELVDAGDVLLASSDNSVDEQAGRAEPELIGMTMDRDTWITKDYYGTNPRDAGMRVVLPGPKGQVQTYFVRVRNANGITQGNYELQIRLQQTQEVPGSLVSFAAIEYATNGVELYGLPTHSPLLGEVAEVLTNVVTEDDNNDTFGTAQYIGNLLASDRDTLLVSGSMSNMLLNSSGIPDIDWYRFDVDHEMINPAAPSFWSTAFDIDYADGMARPDLAIWVYDSTGTLIYSSDDSNLPDDRPGPQEGADLDNLSRGSVGPLDPFIGPVHLPEGNGTSYYVAVTTQASSAAALGQSLLRTEPVDSIERIVEDHIGEWDMSQIGGREWISNPANAFTTPLFNGTTAVALNTYADEFHLGDVVMYISSGNDLYTYDPFTGAFETDVTDDQAVPDRLPGTIPGIYYYDDIAMRNDGRLFSLTSTTYALGRDKNADAGLYVELDTHDARNWVSAQDDGIITYHPVDDDLEILGDNDPAPERGGVNFQALVHEPGDRPITRRVLGVGYVPDETTSPYLRNLLYLMDNTGIAYDHPSVNNDGRPRIPTNIIPLGRLLTGTSLVAVNATDTEDPMEGDILDGSIITVTDEDGTQLTFEFDSGVDIRVDAPGLPQVRDEETFFINGGTNQGVFEFDSGPVLVVSPIIGGGGFAVRDGDTFVIQDTSPNAEIKTWEFQDITNPATETPVVAGNIAIEYTTTMTSLQLLDAIVNTMNGQLTTTATGAIVPTGNPAPDDFEIRITLENDQALQLGPGAQGIMIDGGYGILDPASNNILVPFEETMTATQFEMALATAIGPAIPEVQFSFADRINQTLDDRLTLYHATEVAVEPTGAFAYVNPLGSGTPQEDANNDIFIQAVTTGPTFNGIDIEFTPSLSGGDQARATFNPALNLLRIAIDADSTRANTVVDEINTRLAGIFTARLDHRNDPTNDGTGLMLVQGVAATTYGGIIGVEAFTHWEGAYEPLSGHGIADTSDADIAFGAGDTWEDIAAKIAVAVNKAAVDYANFNAFAEVEGNLIKFDLVTRVMVDSSLVGTPKQSPLMPAGEGPGGDITGMAYVGDTLYAVSDAGGLYEIEDQFSAGFVPDPVLPEPDWWDDQYPQTIQPNPDDPGPRLRYIQTSTAFVGVQFSGLAAGPVNVEGGRYANTLFATSADGTLYAFDTEGVPEPIFLDGVTSVPLQLHPLTSTLPQPDGKTNATITGIDFSPIDYNLWHVTNARWTDDGHGINETTAVDGSRTRLDGYNYPDPSAEPTRRWPGNGSFYFGLEDPRDPNTWGPAQPGSANFVTQNAQVFTTYDMPGGAHGSLTTEPFSLKGYDAGDAPMMYFNYFLEDDGADPYDSARVFASTDGANWDLFGSRNDPLLTDTGGAWRQVGIGLAAYAGEESIQLRFDFATAGEMHVGEYLGTTGTYFDAVPGTEIVDGDTFSITNNAGQFMFEFDMGYSLWSPNVAGASIADGEVFFIQDGTGQYVLFEFDHGNGVGPDSQAVQITVKDSATEVAQKIRDAILASPLVDVTPHLFEIRLHLEGAMNVQVSPGLATLNVLQGDAPGAVAPNATPVPVTQAMTVEQVAVAMATAIDQRFSGARVLLPQAPPIPSAFATVTLTGPNTDLALTAATVDPSLVGVNIELVAVNAVDDEAFVTFDSLTSLLTIDIDPTAVTGTTANTILGAINLEGTFIATLDISADPTNDGTGIVTDLGVMATTTLTSWDGDTFSVGDGVTTLFFEFEDQLLANGVQPGNIPVRYMPGDTVDLVSLAILNAVQMANSSSTVVRPAGGDNDMTFVSALPGDSGLDGTRIEFINNAAIGDQALVTYDPATALITIDVDPLATTASTVMVEVAALTPLLAIINLDVEASNNGTGLVGDLSGIVFETSIGGEPATAAIEIPGINNDLKLTAWRPGLSLGNLDVVFISDTAVGDTANVTLDLANRRLVIDIDPTATTANTVATAILFDGTFIAELDTTVETTNDGTGLIAQLGIAGTTGFRKYQDIVALFDPNTNMLFFDGPVLEIDVMSADLLILGPQNDPSLFTSTKVDGGLIHIIGSSVGLTGPMAYGNFLEGDDPAALQFHEIDRGMDNRHEGFYIDDIVIGFGEHGLMYTDVLPDTSFNAVNPGLAILNGDYQLEIRRMSEFGMPLQRSWDTNDRMVDNLTVQIPPAMDIMQGDTFTIGDGVEQVTFQFRDPALGGVPDGVPIYFNGTETDSQMANMVVAIINANDVLDVTAVSIMTSERIDLFGAAWVEGILKTEYDGDATQPVSVALGDFNNDGRIDAVTANVATGNVSVLLYVANSYNDVPFLGFGFLGLDEPVFYEVGPAPNSVAVEDVNGDGYLDIVTANSEESTISVLLGYGDGTFDKQRKYETSGRPLHAELADVNGDGLLDVVTANFLDNTVDVLLNDGWGAFVLDGTYATGDGPIEVRVDDMDADGLLDLVTADVNDETASVLYGSNTIGFASPVAFSVGRVPTSLAISDLDGDGLVDLITSNELGTTVADPGGAVAVLMNEGMRSFAEPKFYGAGDGAAAVLADDFNGDGIVDLVTANYWDTDVAVVGNYYFNTISTLSGYGDGTFTDPFVQAARRGPVALAYDAASGTSVILNELDGTLYVISSFQVARTGRKTEQSLQGDHNLDRDQGQVIVDANMILHSAEYGIVVDAAQRDSGAGNLPHPGSVAPLREVNNERLVPGVTLKNNLVAFSGSGGIHFSGDANPAGMPVAAVPFGRVVNNTIYGEIGSPNGTGILVDENASPTLLNNIVANLTVGIDIDASSNTSILGATIFQNNLTDRTATTPADPFERILLPTEPLFVDPANANFYLAAGSKAIDSSINAMQDRSAQTDVKDPLGLPPSPILAPELDLFGQLRADDPSVAPPQGFGQKVFKDRGALDRIDFDGPGASLVNPLDNDSAGIDRNPLLNNVFVAGMHVFDFTIQLFDHNGVGIDDNTVIAGAIIVLRDAIELTEGFDYFFRYDATNDIIRLLPAAGIWVTGAIYTVTLDNSPLGIRDLAGNELTPNQPSGEVIFTISLSGLDYGDAPDPDYPSLLENDGARHIIINGYQLGGRVSNESDARQNASAIGDQYDDGVSFDTPLLMGSPVDLSVTATGGGGYLNAWLDFNHDGDWDDAGEQVFVDQALVEGENRLSVDVPAISAPDGIVVGATFARFRFASEPGALVTGEALDGEVEDYKLVMVEYFQDFGDAPDPTYPTLLVSDGARHKVDPKVDLTLGATIDPELDGQPLRGALGDDEDGWDDEDGVEFLSPVVPGTEVELIVSASIGGGLLNAWFDFNDDGNWDDVDEQIFVNLPLQAGDNELSFNVPATAVEGTTTYARFRLSTEADLSYDGFAPNGEVEDYQFSIVAAPEDFGDAPNDLGYPTLLAENGARHTIIKGFQLGQLVDYELNGQPNATATGDDTDGIDDEDGVTLPDFLIPGQQASVTVDVTNNLPDPTDGYLNAWIDYNADGDWDDDGEQIFTDLLLSAGANVLAFTIPLGLDSIETFARFRFSHESGLSPTTPATDKEAPDGEVEDYAVTLVVGDSTISGWKFDDWNGDGVWGFTEPGLAGVTVYLDSNSNGVYDDGEPIAVTVEDDLSTTIINERGMYIFEELFAGDYTVREIRSEDWIQTFPNVDGVDLSNGVMTHYTATPEPNGWYTVALGPATDVADGNFGNFRLGQLSVVDVAIAEGNAGPTVVNVTVELRGSFGRDIEVFYETADGTATVADNDYQQAVGSVVFQPQVPPVPTWDIVSLTSNNSNDFDYNISGSRVVWEREDGNDWEIFLFDGTQTVQLTDNDTDDRFANVSGSYVVWAAHDGNDFEIFLYDGSQTIQLTDNGYDDMKPQVSEEAVTWWGTHYGDIEIFYYDIQAGSAPTNISNNDFDDYDPKISGRNVVWYGEDGNDKEIYLYDGVTVIAVTNDLDDDRRPQIDGNNLVWESHDGTDWDIFSYRIDTAVTVQMTSNFDDDLAPQVSGPHVVWQSFDGYDTEIYFAHLASPTALTMLSDNFVLDELPQVSGNRVAWRQSNPLDANDWEIIFVDLGNQFPAANISNNNAHDWPPQVSDSLVVWRSHDGDDYEIVAAGSVAPVVTETITLIINGDTKIEQDEFFLLNLTGADFANIEDGQAVIDVLNDDGQLDYGDAPEPDYPTLLANNGARHVIVPGFALGARVDAEADGRPNATATGDDTRISDDEDGVMLSTALRQGASSSVTIVATQAGRLDAWIDFNADGDWDDPLEQIFTNQQLNRGQNRLTINVPADAMAGDTFARFRLSTAGGLSYTGSAMNGEVEDHQFEILPTAAAAPPEISRIDEALRFDSAFADGVLLADLFEEAMQFAEEDAKDSSKAQETVDFLLRTDGLWEA